MARVRVHTDANSAIMKPKRMETAAVTPCRRSLSFNEPRQLCLARFTSAAREAMYRATEPKQYRVTNVCLLHAFVVIAPTAMRNTARMTLSVSCDSNAGECVAVTLAGPYHVPRTQQAPQNHLWITSTTGLPSTGASSGVDAPCCPATAPA